LITLRWGQICLLLAAIKVSAGLAGFLVVRDAPIGAIPQEVFAALVLSFGITAGILMFGTRADVRSTHLGAVYLLIASAFADPLALRFAAFSGSFLEQGADLLTNMQIDAFAPYFFWLFFNSFPHTPTSPRATRFAGYAIRTSLITGIVLFLAGVAFPIAVQTAPSSMMNEILNLLSPAPGAYYWLIISALILPAVPFALWKARNAHIEERRRVRIFVFGILIGTLPIIIELTLEALFPAYSDLMNNPGVMLIVSLIIYPALLSIPVMTAYSVLVNHVLAVRLIIRKALQYALARYALAAVVITPALILIFHIYQNRNQTIAGLFSGVGPFWLLGVTLVGAVTMVGRKRAFDALDRSFFRESYDSRKLLSQLVEECRTARDANELTTALINGIDKALHLHSIAVLTGNPGSDLLTSLAGQVRPLSVSSGLARFAANTTKPVDIDLENLASSLNTIPVEDRQWLADGGFRLLVPIIGSDGQLLGLIALGEKKSELPFSSEDRLLFSTIADSAAMTLELQRRRELRPAPMREMPEYGMAMECRECGTLHPHDTAVCESCDSALREAPVPYILLGKFRFIKRVGRGGMGVVYRAIDLMLNRAVAIKMLPRASPEYSVWLRREARAMAAVAHPNLAFIFGAETWQGSPMLIFEFLEGGTLRNRLHSKRLTETEALDLGIVLADVLHHIHSKGVLHRDIKPSNIGYKTPGGMPKLMDFGLAHILEESRSEGWTDREDLPSLSEVLKSTTQAITKTKISILENGRVLGTPLYLSPEAALGAPADTSFDIWATAVLLYESLAGVNPFEKMTLRKTLEAIAKAEVPVLREHNPDCSERIAQFFTDALAKDPKRRPSNAKELKARLELVRLESAALRI